MLPKILIMAIDKLIFINNGASSRFWNEFPVSTIKARARLMAMKRGMAVSYIKSK
jgi:hypothetical protein